MLSESVYTLDTYSVAVIVTNSSVSLSTFTILNSLSLVLV